MTTTPAPREVLEPHKPPRKWLITALFRRAKDKYLMVLQQKLA